jgi:hypothetical protein
MFLRCIGIGRIGEMGYGKLRPDLGLPSCVTAAERSCSAISARRVGDIEADFADPARPAKPKSENGDPCRSPVNRLYLQRRKNRT